MTSCTQSPNARPSSVRRPPAWAPGGLSTHACGCFPIIRSYLPARPPARQDWACQPEGLRLLQLPRRSTRASVVTTPATRGSVAASPQPGRAACLPPAAPAWARPGGKAERSALGHQEATRGPGLRSRGRRLQPPRLPTGLIRICCNAFVSQSRPLNIFGTGFRRQTCETDTYEGLAPSP